MDHSAPLRRFVGKPPNWDAFAILATTGYHGAAICELGGERRSKSSAKRKRLEYGGAALMALPHQSRLKTKNVARCFKWVQPAFGFSVIDDAIHTH